MKKALLTNPAFRYIFEIFIIVFSVTVSFYIQEVINKKEKIKLKNKALIGVLMELKTDVSNFNNASRILKARIRMGEEFLNGDFNNFKLNQLMLFLELELNLWILRDAIFVLTLKICQL